MAHEQKSLAPAPCSQGALQRITASLDRAFPTSETGRFSDLLAAIDVADVELGGSSFRPTQTSA